MFEHNQKIKNRLWNGNPKAKQESMITGSHYRFTVLTPCLIRMEYREDGKFEDRATQIVWNRDFEPVSYRIVPDGEGFLLYTDRVRISYDGREFSASGLSAQGMGGLHAYGCNWRYGEPVENLGGTARTLDGADGACSLQDGVLSAQGCAVLDDGASLVLTDEGWIEPRTGGGSDIYLFMYGTEYKKALSDFYRLTGKTPMLPRFALGNWWSRYYEYSETSYKELVEKFEKERIPFSVAVIDMDWHLVKEVDFRYGSGWTGYTWNKKLFPNPKEFLAWLHEHGMRATLNLHPADGIRAYEACYPEIAEAMGVDREKEEPVVFDAANPKFWEAYFEKVLHPMEEEGVDFWWIDWQQGNNTKIPGLDPLWMLNHYHYLDNGRIGKRALAFSRYAGPGSHRYSVGFSGDTVMSWESLDFQPRFTATASNIGYGWWSHDIGGHMQGYKDEDMAARWLQYGVFSPINRLHSSKSEFNGKEPWRYSAQVHEMMNRFLRLRHQLLPYIYTMNHRAYQENLPIITPMYYDYPKVWAAYWLRNQYMFGSELLVAPITSPQIEKLHVGKVHAWLPDGVWIDFFTGTVYEGGRELLLYRDISSIPVLAKAGAIVPMTQEINSGGCLEKNPKELDIRVFAGADGSFTLYEDDNETLAYLEGICAETDMRLDWENGSFVIQPVRGELFLIPSKRVYRVCFCGVKNTEVTVLADKMPVEFTVQYDEKKGNLEILISDVGTDKKIECLLKETALYENPVKERIFDFLDQAEITFEEKERVYGTVCQNLSAAAKIAQMQAMKISEEIIAYVTELLTAR